MGGKGLVASGGDKHLSGQSTRTRLFNHEPDSLQTLWEIQRPKQKVQLEPPMPSVGFPRPVANPQRLCGRHHLPCGTSVREPAKRPVTSYRAGGTTAPRPPRAGEPSSGPGAPRALLTKSPARAPISLHDGTYFCRRRNPKAVTESQKCCFFPWRVQKGEHRPLGALSSARFPNATVNSDSLHDRVSTLPYVITHPHTEAWVSGSRGPSPTVIPTEGCSPPGP